MDTKINVAVNTVNWVEMYSGSTAKFNPFNPVPVFRAVPIEKLRFIPVFPACFLRPLKCFSGRLR